MNRSERQECREVTTSGSSSAFSAVQVLDKRHLYITLAILVWTVMTLACLAKAYLKPTKNTVFPIYTFAAGEWRAGRDLYVKMPEYDYYRYSPLMAAFFVPWRELSDAWGGVIWRLVGMGILTWALWRWIRDVLQLKCKSVIAGIYLLVAPFVLQNLHNGQSNVHMLGFLLLGMADAATGNAWRSALWFALAGFIKPYVLAIAGLIAIIEQRLFVRLAVVLIAGVAVTFMFQKPAYVADQHVKWFFHFFENDRSGSAMRDWYRDLQLLFRIYLWPLPPRVYYLGSALIGLGMAGIIYRLRSTISRPQLVTLAAALGGCWVTVLGPATESCTYILLAPMLAGAIMTQSGWPRAALMGSWWLFFLTISTALFPANWKVQVWGPQPIAALIFLGAVSYEVAMRWKTNSHLANVSIRQAA